MNAQEAIAELKAARRAWHEDFSVPVSHTYGRFLQAIGNVQDLLEASVLQQAAPSQVHQDEAKQLAEAPIKGRIAQAAPEENAEDMDLLRHALECMDRGCKRCGRALADLRNAGVLSEAARRESASQ